MFGVVATGGPNGTESEISRLRRENADLRTKIAEFRCNDTQQTKQEVGKPENTASHVKDAHSDDELQLLKNTVRLLKESIHTYNNFIKNGADRIENEGLADYCGGDDYNCPVREAVKAVLVSFGKCADDLRENAESMVAAVHKTIKCASAAH